MMGYGHYGGMMGGFGWMWVLLVLAVGLAIVVWGARTGIWSRVRASEPTPLDILRRRYANGEISAPEFEQAKQMIA